jgi:hypothetical protein
VHAWTAENAFQSAWSPDGRQIATIHMDTSGSMEDRTIDSVDVLDVTTGSRRRLDVNGGVLYLLGWSHDSTSLYFGGYGLNGAADDPHWGFARLSLDGPDGIQRLVRTAATASQDIITPPPWAADTVTFRAKSAGGEWVTADLRTGHALRRFRPARDGFTLADGRGGGNNPACTARSLSAEFVVSGCDRQLQVFSLASGALVTTRSLPAGIGTMTAAPAPTALPASASLVFTTR